MKPVLDHGVTADAADLAGFRIDDFLYPGPRSLRFNATPFKMTGNSMRDGAGIPQIIRRGIRQQVPGPLLRRIGDEHLEQKRRNSDFNGRLTAVLDGMLRFAGNSFDDSADKIDLLPAESAAVAEPETGKITERE